MLLRLQNAASSMAALAQEQERLSNNLANANTAGFKRDRVFVEALNERLDAELAPRSDRRHLQWADGQQGRLESTGNPLDVAINGEGFFVVNDDDGGERYTRAGHFVVGADRTLRTVEGLEVQGQGGPLQIPEDATDIIIGRGGRIEAGGQQLGRLRVVNVDNPMQLQRLDGASFAADGVEVNDMEDPTILQGHVEMSNVNPVEAMTDMISNFRLFESQQRMLRTSDELLGRITRDLGSF